MNMICHQNNMEILGRGGYGTIYATPNADLVKKVHEGDCNSLYHEFAMQRIAYEAVPNNPFYGVPEPSKWRLNEYNGCSFIMDRVHPPDLGPLSWHLYLDHPNPMHDETIQHPSGAIRGRYLGSSTILSLLPGIDLHKIAYYAGLLISTVQYGSMQTALDTELVIETYDWSDNLKIFLIDYDKSIPWRANDPPYDDLVFALEAEPYWPTQSSYLYKDFKRGYLEGASTFGFKDIAMAVLNDR